MTKQKNVRWKCPECGNYHSWYWSKYDVFPGEITMNCDNPKCEAQSKMMMTVDENGNGTAVVYKEDKEPEDKLRRETEKVMNSQTEIDPSRILKDNDFIWYMGEKYQKVEEPQKSKTFYQILCDDKWSDGDCNLFCDYVDEWMSQYSCDYVVCAEYLQGYNACLETLKSSLR